MPSPEGRGLARKAWDSYQRGARKVARPLVEPFAKEVGASAVADLIGFWVLWHLHGGFEGLQAMGMSRASIYRRISLFRKLFKVHPDEYQLPGVTLDIAEYRSTTGQAKTTRSG